MTLTKDWRFWFVGLCLIGLLGAFFFPVQSQQQTSSMEQSLPEALSSTVLASVLEEELRVGVLPDEERLSILGFSMTPSGYYVREDESHVLIYGSDNPDSATLVLIPKEQRRASDPVLSALLAQREFEVSVPDSIRIRVATYEGYKKGPSGIPLSARRRVLVERSIEVGLDGIVRKSSIVVCVQGSLCSW